MTASRRGHLAVITTVERLGGSWGWEAVCECGWHSQVRRLRVGAVDEYRAHRYGPRRAGRAATRTT